MPEVHDLLRQRKAKAKDLLLRAEKLNKVTGIGKLLKKISAESEFLISLEKRQLDEASIEKHLVSSNLTHLEAILTCAEYAIDVSSVLKKFSYSIDENLISEISVDVEGYNGKLWLKVFARNPFALHRMWEGSGQYGDKDVCKVATEYLNAAKENLIDFASPKTAFLFVSGVTHSVADDLKRMGVKVVGEIINDPSDMEQENKGKYEQFDNIESCVRTHLSLLEFCDQAQSNIKKMNLDITTLIALVSSLTNDSCFSNFSDDILNLQAEEEMKEPLLPVLNSFLQGKELYVCKTALKDFNKILSTIGGPKEIERAKKLIERLNAVEDSPSERAKQLALSASIKERSKIIFGTGDTLQATTTTSNRSFVRAASGQGVDFSVFFHSSRALTEKKETLS